MSKTLKSFQKDRLSDIGKFHKQAILPANSTFTTRTCIVSGPTGSGKTFIISEAIKKFFANAFVLVLSPGAGNLDSQTLDVLTEGLSPAGFDVAELRTTDLRNKPRAKQVRVINWQSVASLDQKTGSYINRLTRFGGEKENLFSFLAKKGVPVIIIIDEAHHGKGVTAKSIPLFLANVNKSLGYTPMVFEFSATPVLPKALEDALVSQPQEDGTPGLTIVKDGNQLVGYTATTYSEAVDAQLLRRRTLLNDGIREVVASWSEEEAQSKDSRLFLVEQALRKQRELRGLYAKKGISVWPLIGIQLPNSAEGNEVKTAILSYLANLDKHIPGESPIREKKELAYYFQDNKSDVLDGIESHGSQVRVLLYKTAVATGWNCPRAQILVGFRMLNSKQFSIQNRGRFLRTLEGKHYGEKGSSPLDWAYIYADVPTMGGLAENPDKKGHEYVQLTADPKRKAEWDAFGLPTGGLERTGQDTVAQSVLRARLEHFYPVFSKKFQSDFADLSAPVSAEIAEGVEELPGEGFTQKGEAVQVRAKTELDNLQQQVAVYLTEEFTAGGVHHPARNYIRNARVAEHVTRIAISILRSQPALVAKQLEAKDQAFETFIIPRITAATVRNTAADGTEDVTYAPVSGGSEGLRDWVRAVFTSDEVVTSAPRIKRGEVIVTTAGKPAEPAPLAEGASRDHWNVKFTGSHQAAEAALAVAEEDESNYLPDHLAGANLYHTASGKTLPIGADLKDTEKAFEDYLFSLKSLAEVSDIWYSKSSTGESDFQLPVEWELNGVTRVTRMFPDYFGVITLADGSKKPFVFEVKPGNPEGLDGKKTGVTKAKAEALSRYAAKTGAFAAVVYPTDAAMTHWSTFRAKEANRLSVREYVKASTSSPMQKLTKYDFAVKSYDKAPDEYNWMLETIQL